ncbi:protein kinase domain-containing protein [Micromonospora sp. BQ11]|uniref:serine/threonine-protein kinase n=1 Tax=Micromonospora sp. BQ11 TaxID=3452212 RepID=UPI003F8A5A85
MRGQEVLGQRYRLVSQLGVGGMGVVWSAFDRVLDRQVAVKVLTPQYAGDAGSRRRVLAEARAAARLTHPHVANVYDYGESVTADGERVPFVVMELLPGRSLADRLKRGPVSVELALRVNAEIASALASAHAHGLVHRDVKPANVMLTPTGAKVVDFGLAAAVGQADDTDGSGQVLGTAAYLAPERLLGHRVVAASDVYALGLILYRMLAGRPPWTTETVTQMLTAHAYQEPAPLPRLPGVPPVVADLLHRCLTKDPTRRPASKEVAVTLAHAAGIRVPIEGTHDVLDDVLEDGSDPADVSVRSGSSGRRHPGSGSDDLAPWHVGAIAAHTPFRNRLREHLDGDLDHVTLRRRASLLLRGAVGFDLAIWAVLDPMTLMWASCVIDGDLHDAGFEHELFANEYGQDDVLKLVDLADGPFAGGLVTATHGDPYVSRRFRTILDPRGFTDELRLTFTDDVGTCGALLLYRAGGRFTEADLAQLTPAGPLLGAALRRTLVRGEDRAPVAGTTAEEAAGPARVRRNARERLARLTRREPAGPARPTTPRPRTPVTGALTISADGRLFDLSEDARALLDTTELDRVGVAVTRGRLSGLVDASGAGHDGRWLAFHAAHRENSVDVTVQRIRPHQVSEFVCRARKLQPWQWRLLGGVVRGRSTRRIAADLGMSAYSVQEGMMSLFTTFGVAGRIDLTKTLFFDHYLPLHAADSRVTRD